MARKPSKLTGTAQRRLQAEERNMRQDTELGFYPIPHHIENTAHDLDYSIWHVFIRGSPSSLYENTILHATFEIPPEYPIQPPVMTFKTQMFHPNIYSDGKVCISILHVADDDPTSYESADEKWTPVQSIRTIVMSVISLLNEPNCQSPANVDASKMYKENKELFYKTAREMALGKGMTEKELCEFLKYAGPDEMERMKKSLDIKTIEKKKL